MSCERPAFPGTPHEHLLWDAIRPSLRFPLLTAHERYRGGPMKRVVIGIVVGLCRNLIDNKLLLYTCDGAPDSY